MKDKVYRLSVSVNKNIYAIIQNIAQSKNDSLANVIRELIEKGLAQDWVEENNNLIASIIRQQMEIVIKPHIERLASLSSKSGHMSATAAFLNVQALMDLVPKEQRKNVREMYENARKKSAEYMRTKTGDWESNF